MDFTTPQKNNPTGNGPEKPVSSEKKKEIHMQT